MVRYIVVDTRTWLPGKQILVPPRWITAVSWDESRVHVDLLREDMQDSPAFDPTAPVKRQYEKQLYEYYGRPPYWQ